MDFKFKLETKATVSAGKQAGEAATPVVARTEATVTKREDEKTGQEA